MEPSVLTTKLSIPLLRSQAVSRPRLVERCNRALGCSLTLISAPAGFGKTTLLGEWVAKRASHLPVAWLSLDDADNDPARFWRHFIAAVRTLYGEAGTEALELLDSGQQAPIPNILTELLNDLAAVKTDFFLILDDYHFIQSPPIHDGMAFFLEHLPARMHLIIATRIDPPLPLPRLRGRGQLQDIRGDDLRFTREELAAMMTALDCPTLETDQMEALSSRTEGWAAGFKMAVLSLKDRPDISSFLEDFTASPRYIMDYLIEEVLGRQPEEERDFLLRTSILGRLSPSLCDTLTGGTDGRKILQNLEKKNLFIVRLDGAGEWYRYEHLFADLLRHQLELGYDTGKIAELHSRASRWYEANGYIEEAVHHATAANDWVRVMGLVTGADIIRTRGGLTAYQWLVSVPRERLLANTRAAVTFAWALVMTGRALESAAFLNTFEKSPACAPGLEGTIAAIRTYIGITTLDPATERYAELALGTLPADSVYPRATVSFLLGMYYASGGRFAEAEPLLKTSAELHRSIGDNYSLSMDLGMQAIVRLMQDANLFQAEAMLQEAVVMGKLHPNAAVAYAHLGLINYFWDRLDEASTLLDKALSLHPGNMDILTNAQFYTILVRLGQGRLDEAEELLKQTGSLIEARGGNARLRARLAGYHIALEVARDDMKAAFQWLDRFAEYEDVFVCDAPVDAMRLLHERWGNAIEKKLEPGIQQFRKDDLKFYLMPTLTELALVTSDPEKAMNCLAEALGIGRPYRYVRVFINWGTALSPLLRRAIKRGIEPAYARELLDRIEAEERLKRTRTGGGAAQLVPKILTERELQVLRLIADGASNPGIAERLAIDLATVKTHVHHIIDKLEVRDRSQAVYRAREINLL